MGKKTFLVYLANQEHHTFEYEDFVFIVHKGPFPNTPTGLPMIFMSSEDASLKTTENANSKEKSRETGSSGGYLNPDKIGVDYRRQESETDI